jgi:PKD repeat protein
LLLLPAILLIALATVGCNDESKPYFTRVRVTPACGVVPLQVESFAAVSGGNETGPPLGGTNNLEISWTFGDGGTGKTAVAYHRYLDPGTYQVTVTAKDPDGNASSTSVPVLVLADSLQITASSNFPDGNVPLGQRILFETSGLGCNVDYPTVPGDSVKLVYRWTMGNAANTVYQGPRPRHTYATAGTYIVNLAVTDPMLAVTRRATMEFVVAP